MLPLLDVLKAADLEHIHEASKTILRKTGLIFNDPVSLDFLKRAGARTENDRVWFEWELVEQALALAPRGYTLHGRRAENNVRIGAINPKSDDTRPGNSTVIMPGGGPAFVRDLQGVRRPGKLADLIDLTKLSHMSENVHVIARKAVEAQDIPVPYRHLETWKTILHYSDKPAQSGFIGGKAEAEDVLALLAIVHGGVEQLLDRPVAHCSVNVNSPLFYDTAMLEGLISFARLGQPVLISPFVMAGVSGPTTLAGTIAQQNAEVLAGITLAQLVRPGTPVLYGAATSNVDLRNANPAIGSPESALSTAICAQLARHYGLPSRGGGALTDSPAPDAQSSYERMFTLLTTVLSGVHYVMQGLGILESYLTMSLEQFVIDLDLIDMIRAFVGGIEISEETLALDTIDQVGPGGFYLDAAHTMRHYRDAHFIPHVSIRQPFEQWQEAGSVDALARANARCKDLLEAYEKPPLARGVADQIDDYIVRRKRELETT